MVFILLYEIIRNLKNPNVVKYIPTSFYIRKTHTKFFFKPEEPCDVVDLVYDTSDRNVQYSIEWADIVLFCNFDKRGKLLVFKQYILIETEKLSLFMSFFI